MTASMLQQLLALYFANIYSWQLSSSEKSLVGKKCIHISQGFYRFLLYKYFFIHFLWEMPVYLVGYAKRMLYSWQPTILFAWRHLNTMHLTLSTKILKIQIPPRTISRNPQFLSFDGLSHYLYLLKIEPAFVPLKKNRRQKYLWPGERSSSHLKVTQMRSSPDIKYLSGHFVDFCCREGISCFV